MTGTDPPVLRDWAGSFPSNWVAGMRASIAKLGPPVYGVAGPLATTGVVYLHGGWLGADVLGIRFGPPDREVLVTNARQPQGGTDKLVQEVLQPAGRALAMPFTVSVEERLVMIPVDGTRTQFRVVSASTGHWVAAGGLRKRHLHLSGVPGTSPEEIELVPILLA